MLNHTLALGRQLFWYHVNFRALLVLTYIPPALSHHQCHVVLLPCSVASLPSMLSADKLLYAHAEIQSKRIPRNARSTQGCLLLTVLEADHCRSNSPLSHHDCISRRLISNSGSLSSELWAFALFEASDFSGVHVVQGNLTFKTHSL